MRFSLKIGTYWGIPVFLHWSFGLIFLYAAWEGFTSENGGKPLGATVFLSGLFAAMFLCVLLHEFGHALMARRFGVKTQDIILTPIGGIARLETMPKKPIQEFWVALAGPAVNVLIALALFLPVVYMVKTDGATMMGYLGDNLRSIFTNRQEGGDSGGMEAVLENPWPVFWLYLLFINCSLVVFNMIPAFPMDGGRVLRALLAMRFSHVKATQVAAFFGQIFAAGFVALGFWKGNVTMPLIGFFIFNAARSEYGMVKLEDLLNRFQPGNLAKRAFTELLVNDWMQTPIEIFKTGTERNFLVVDMDGNVIGLLGEAAIAQAIKSGRTSAPVGDFYRPPCYWVESNSTMREVYGLIKYNGFPIVWVHKDGACIGVIDAPLLDAFLKKEMG